MRSGKYLENHELPPGGIRVMRLILAAPVVWLLIGIAECRVGALERGARSVSWRLILKSGLRQQPIPVGNMHALQCFELLEDRPRYRAIQAVRFVM